jgi:hypothetical protein
MSIASSSPSSPSTPSFLSLTFSQEQVAIYPFEITIDLLVACDLFDPVDRSGMTLRGKKRSLPTVQLFHQRVSVVDRVGQVSRGVLGLAVRGGVKVG